MAETRHGSEPRPAVKATHERTDIHVGLLAKLGIGLVVLTLVMVVGVLLLFRSIVSREAGLEPPRSPLAASPEPYAGPRLQVSPPVDAQEVLAAERERLAGYGWVNRDAGVVRIPIERAMELLVERGVTSGDAEVR